ncbi:hypothetical protein, partial [Klebsiella pneumoniae]|uniref:hypothetical protein n=1 Tax=Klebsiella pneumoniae TaxID=573 RepID=UPI001B8BE288
SASVIAFRVCIAISPLNCKTLYLMGGGQTARRWHGMGQRSADDHAGSEGCGRKPVSSIEAVARTRDDNTAISIIVVVGGK